MRCGARPCCRTRAPEDGMYEPYWSRLPHAADTCPELVSCTCKRRDAIGVASYGHWGTCSPFSTCNCLIFFVTSEPHKLCRSTPCGCLSSKNIHAYSFFAIHCMNSIILIELVHCSTLWQVVLEKYSTPDPRTLSVIVCTFFNCSTISDTVTVRKRKFLNRYAQSDNATFLLYNLEWHCFSFISC